MLHTLIEIGSTALVPALLYPGKVTQISHKGQRSTKNELFFTILLQTYW